MIPLLVSTALLLTCSHLLVRCLCPATLTGTSTALLRAALTGGVAIGLSSLSYFLALVLSGNGDSLGACEAIVYLGTSVVLGNVLYRRRAQSVPAPHPGASGTRNPLFVPLLITLLLVGSFALVRFTMYATVAPHGQWDAYAIWNVRARFLYRGGDNWADAFTDTKDAAHVDYPLLLPAAVARLWQVYGNDTSLVPRGVALCFTLCGLGILVGGTRCTRSTGQALLAGATLLCGNFWIDHGWSQYADTPLAFYILATLALLTLYDQTPIGETSLLVLAGLTAGCAVWTKNEGSLFLACLLASRAAWVTLTRGWRPFLQQAAWMSAALVPVLVVVAYFKMTYASQNDLVAHQGSQATLERLTDPARYVTIVEHVAAQLVYVPLSLAVGLALYVVVARVRPRQELVQSVAAPLLCLLLMAAGYFVVYLTTPHDLGWHLRNSLDRILLQLCPAAIFVYFSAVGTPEQIVASLQAPQAGQRARPLGN